MSTDLTSFRARWVFPADGPPIENGTVEITGTRITALHDRNDPQAVDLGNVAVLPGLINAHAHLEFSTLERPLGPVTPFAGWIRSVVDWRSRRMCPVLDAVRTGLDESLHAGTTTIGEIATSGWSVDAFADIPGTAVVFREQLGFSASRIAGQLEIARSHLEDATDSGCVVRGLSPHAPYSVHPDLFHGLVELAREFRAPLAVHLAETREELELLSSRSGPLVDLLIELGLWDDVPQRFPSGPLEYLHAVADLPRALVVHGNYLNDEELAYIADHRNISVVYCPRTHAYFRREPHPWRQLLERGASVAIGTDGRASNPDLNVWNEIQFLRRLAPAVNPALLLQLGTICGARTLGLEQRCGSITPGKQADLSVVALPHRSGSSCWDLLYDSSSVISGAIAGGVRQ